MTITSEHLQILKAPFPPDDHEFLRGMAYLREGAIAERIEQVDPAWRGEVVNISNREGVITVLYRMTLLGVIRENTGMAQVMQSKAGAEANEAEKSATTDAFKRAARMFGVGRYLLSLPRHVNDEKTLARHLGGGQSPQALPSGGMSEENIANLKAWWESQNRDVTELYAALGCSPEQFAGNNQEAFAKIKMYAQKNSIQLEGV